VRVFAPYRLNDFLVRIVEPFLSGAPDTADSILLTIEVGLHLLGLQETAILSVNIMTFTTEFGMCRLRRQATLGNSLTRNGRPAIVAACPETVRQLSVLFGHEPLVIVLFQFQASPAGCLRHRNNDCIRRESSFLARNRFGAAAPLLIRLTKTHFLNFDLTNFVAGAKDLRW
jgi:hypothetical protein